MKTKKANLEDPFIIIAVMIAAAIAIIIVYHVWTQISPELASGLQGALPSGETSFNVTSTFDTVTGAIKFTDIMFPLFLVGMILMTIISAFFIATNPIFFFICIILLMIMMTITPMLSNFYQSFIATEAISSSASNFPITNFLIEKLPWVGGILLIIVLIVLFAKPTSQGQV